MTSEIVDAAKFEAEQIKSVILLIFIVSTNFYLILKIKCCLIAPRQLSFRCHLNNVVYFNFFSELPGFSFCSCGRHTLVFRSCICFPQDVDFSGSYKFI